MLFQTVHFPAGALANWPGLDDAAKRDKYSKYACHELNFFLSRKDPEFFKTTVLPYLKNKKDKTFLDHYLLGDDLSRFLDPWRYGRLNMAERVHRLRRRCDFLRDPSGSPQRASRLTAARLGLGTLGFRSVPGGASGAVASSRAITSVQRSIIALALSIAMILLSLARMPWRIASVAAPSEQPRS